MRLAKIASFDIVKRITRPHSFLHSTSLEFIWPWYQPHVWNVKSEQILCPRWRRWSIGRKPDLNGAYIIAFHSWRVCVWGSFGGKWKVNQVSFYTFSVSCINSHLPQTSLCQGHFLGNYSAFVWLIGKQLFFFFFPFLFSGGFYHPEIAMVWRF